MKEAMTEIERGLYQFNLGGASLGECWRLSRSAFGYVTALYWKFRQKRMHYLWMPYTEARHYCDFSAFQERTRRILAPEVKNASMLGFQDGLYTTADTYFLEGYTEPGGYSALHHDKKRFIRIAYVYRRNEVGNFGMPIVTESLIYLIGFCDTTGQLICVHNDRLHFDSCGPTKAYYVNTSSIIKIAERAERELAKHGRNVKSFSTLHELDAFYEPIENNSCLHRINRGLFVKVPEEEERRILEKRADCLNSSGSEVLKNKEEISNNPDMLFRNHKKAGHAIWIIGIIVLIFAGWPFLRRIIPSEIEYQGEKIKLTKYYYDYDSYKDDPDNIHPSENARVEQLVREAVIAPWFPNRQEMIRGVFDLPFPGYGLSCSGEKTLSDGSIIASYSIEIPRTDQGRYLVFIGKNGLNGKFMLIDDFIETGGSFLLRIQEQDGKLVFGRLPDIPMFEREFIGNEGEKIQ